MTVQHRLIPEAQLHEPKGISTAVINKVYKSNGAGSGTWDDVDSSMLQGLSGDGGVAGKRPITNGTNGFSLITDAAYGAQVITNNSVAFPLVAVADTTFNTPSQYTLLTGVGAPWLSENMHNIAFSTDRLTVSVTGVYMIHLWMNIAQFTGNTAKVSIRYRINGAAYSSRKPTIKSAIAADISQLSGFGLISLTAGDYIQLYAASDTTGNLVIGDCSSLLELIRAT